MIKILTQDGTKCFHSTSKGGKDFRLFGVGASPTFPKIVSPVRFQEESRADKMS